MSFAIFEDTRINADGSITHPRMHDLANDFIGRVLVNKTKRQGWINIPKNASNTIGEFLEGYKTHNWILEPEFAIDYRYLVVLRDPVDRWKKVQVERFNIAAEYIKYDGKLVNKHPEIFSDWWNEIWIKRKHELTVTGNFADIYTDIHNFRQTDHLMGLNIKDIHFVFITDNLEQEIQDWTGINKKMRNMNVSEDNTIKRLIIQHLGDEIFNNSELDDKLRQAYALDYKLIEIVKNKG